MLLSRTIDKYRDAGTPIDGDQQFMRLITEWVHGHLSMAEVAAQSRDRRLTGTPVPFADEKTESNQTRGLTQSELLDQLADIIGLHDIA